MNINNKINILLNINMIINIVIFLLILILVLIIVNIILLNVNIKNTVLGGIGGRSIDFGILNAIKNHYPYYYCKKDCPNIDNLLIYIFNNNKIVRYLYDPNGIDAIYNGTKKQVFLLKNGKIFKLIFGEYKNINKILKEPIYMTSNSDICNAAQDIIIYGNGNVNGLSLPTNIKFILRAELQMDWFIVTWFEDIAEFDLSHTADVSILERYIQFKQETRNRLIADNMSDEEIGGNVGYFINSPHFRYIDLMSFG
uniref:Uncharacterized protein n=1 Tax=viral metagenome TaxID=1070528 RepID=A0A6C0I0E3_9ZZZZ